MDKQIKILVDCSHVSIPYMGMIVYTIGLVKGLVEETNMKVAILISDKCSKYT